MRILITGGTGLLALNWACAVRDRHEVVLGTHRRTVKLARTSAVALPLDDSPALTSAVAKIRPDMIVHTAGITSVEECERDEAAARRVYVDLSRNVVRAARDASAAFAYISTDHLFSGTHALSSEETVPDPVNAYARVKLLSEQVVAEAHPNALILRTNFFGWGHRYRRSFSDWIYYSLLEGRPITMFDDVFVTPIHADRVAFAAHELLESGATGIYNVVGDERISKYDFGMRLADAFDLPKALLQRGKIATSKLFVKRPSDMSLDNRKARERLGSSLGDVAEHLRLLRQQCADRRGELLAAVAE